MNATVLPLRRPNGLRVLDLCCGAGGLSMGYHLAGFDVTGVDNRPQPHYPFTFHQADALTYLAALTASGEIQRYDLVHASWPCQNKARVTAWRGSREDHPDLITPGGELQRACGRPWVIENVPEAAWDGTLRPDYLLCGTQFGLNVRRHRVFESSWGGGGDLVAPCWHRKDLLVFAHKGERAYADAMGCTWMSNVEARQAVPPRLQPMDRSPVPHARKGRRGMTNHLLNAALAAAARGWRVFPLRPGDKRPALHGQAVCPGLGDCAGGHRKWEQRATLAPDRIRRAWADRPFNIGIATGPSGLIVVDLDMPKPTSSTGTPSGVTTFEALCERAGQAVPATYRVRTASGGQHLYFTAPDGPRLGNTAGTLAPLVDTRAWGGYVVAPGSTTHSGTYEVTDPTPPVELPAWLADALSPVPHRSRPVEIRVQRCGTRAAEVALQRETAAVAAASEGGRNSQLLRSARAVGRFVAWGDIPRHVAEEAFQGAGEAAGLPAAECRATVRSALNWSIRTCRPQQEATA